ncbi:MAG: alpha/beta hydrolase [Promethearchaeota archaeon]|nr:MAG: alpha/beta hydrolase [Candidatus Lokiarchaeota archaeon]
MPYFTADDGERIYYSEVGSGYPLFFIHGWMSDGLDFKNNIIYFSKTYRCITLDIRGHGLSKRIHKNLNLNQVARDIQTLIYRLDLDSIIMIGHSMGAVVIFSYISQFKTNSLKGICIIDQLPKLLKDKQWNFGVEGGIAIIDKLEQSLNNDFSTFIENVTKQNNSMDRTIRSMDRKTILTFFKELCTYDYRALMPEIDIPVLCMLKSEGNLPLNPLGKWYQKNLPKCTYIEFPESGHWIFKDKEEKFNLALEIFIKQIINK